MSDKEINDFIHSFGDINCHNYHYFDNMRSKKKEGVVFNTVPLIFLRNNYIPLYRIYERR